MDPVSWENSCNFDPAGDPEAVALAVPARWVVYLLADGDSRPVQLLCVRNLRASLRRRLAEGNAEPSRRIDYRQLVRKIFWRRVDSQFEADLIYFDYASALFPQAARDLISSRRAWFVHIDPSADFPRYTRACALDSGELFGPLAEKSDASRLIESLEDCFDLCRYHNILVQAPHGKACAYKEMGRCPAPCDGSIDMDQYRRMIELSMRVLSDPQDVVREHAHRMQQASAELRFEAAAKIKPYVDSLSALCKGPFRFVRSLRDFRYVSLQRGPGSKTAKVFLITPGATMHLMSLTNRPVSPEPAVAAALDAAGRYTDAPADALRIGLVAEHLLAARAGVFLPLEKLDAQSFLAAYQQLHRQKVSDGGEEEGIQREISA